VDKVIKGIDIKLSYSNESEILIKSFGNQFDRNEFEKEFLSNIPVGTGNILIYMTEKTKREIKENQLKAAARKILDKDKKEVKENVK